MNNLGIIYENVKNYEKAKEWYTKSVNLGNTNTMINLGLLYEEENDYESAKELYHKAIDLGHVSAKNNLEHLKRKYPELFRKNLEKIYDSESCSICYENYIGSSSYKIILNCGHTFHYSCVKKEERCPHCREPLNF